MAAKPISKSFESMPGSFYLVVTARDASYAALSWTPTKQLPGEGQNLFGGTSDKFVYTKTVKGDSQQSQSQGRVSTQKVARRSAQFTLLTFKEVNGRKIYAKVNVSFPPHCPIIWMTHVIKKSIATANLYPVADKTTWKLMRGSRYVIGDIPNDVLTTSITEWNTAREAALDSSATKTPIA